MKNLDVLVKNITFAASFIETESNKKVEGIEFKRIVFYTYII